MRHFNRGRKVFIYLLLFAFIFPNAYLPKTEASPNGAPELQSAVSGNADGMINAIVYANGKYIAVGDRGYIGQSPDGLQWTRIAAPVSNEATSWRSIVFAKNMYVAVGLNTSSTSTAKLMTSPDGENWTDRSSSIDGTILQKAVFLNDQFFAVGGRWSGNDRSLDVGIIYSSTDGVNWTLTAAPEKFWPVSSTTSTPFFLTDMAYISGRYVVGGNVFGSYGHSTNLSSWTKGFIDDYAISFFSVYNNKLYVISNGSNAYSSSDGITFAPAPDYNGMRGSLQDGSTLYRFGIGGNWFESADDGASWTQKTAITNVTILDAATNGSSFVLVTNGKNSLVVSPDHSIWSRIEGDLQGVVSNGSQWVGVATAPSRSGGEADSFLLTSSSGLGNLSPAADFFPNIEFYDVAYGNNTFIAIGKKIARSSDGVTWTLDDLPAGIAGQITAITYGSSQGFVAVTNGGSILASPDGSSWTVDNSNSGTAFSHVKDVNGVYIATVPYESVWVSDGSGGNWSALDSLSDYYALYYDLSDVTYGAGTYAISGSDENGNPVVLTAAANSLDEIAVWDTHAIDNSVYTTLKTIEYSDGYFVTGGLEYHSSSPETYVLYATSDFTNWADYNEQTLGISSSAINSITVLNGTFYIVGDNNARIVLGEPSGPVAQPEPTPAAVISFTDEQLTGLAANAVYLINGQNISTDANGKVAIDSAWLGGSLSIVKVGNGTTSTNSSAQSLIIPDRPAAPTGVGKTDESYAGANDGSLTGLPVGGEYKQGAAGAWSDISSATVSGLQPDTYYVRVKATSSAFVSEEAAITVGSTSATPEVTPAAVISFTDEQLTGLAANAVYLINGQNISADANGKIAIDSAWLGGSLSIVKVGNGTTSTNSPAQSLIIPDRPAAPTGVGKTDESYAGANDGSLTGLPVGGEYKQGAAGAWSDISSATVSGLQPDTYYVRSKATSSAFVSEEAAITVGSTSATPEVTPAAVISFTDEQLTGLAANAVYLINGQNISTDANGKVAIDSAWLGGSLSIVKVGNGTTSTNSSAQSLIIPDRPAAPTGVGKTDESYAGANDGSLTGLPVGGEYKQGAAGAWSDISSATVSGLQPDTYYVRTKATSSAFVSEEAAITVGSTSATPEVTPAAVISFTDEQLTGLAANAVYLINGQNVSADLDGKIAIDSAWLGETLSIVKVGNGTTSTNSSAQSLIIPDRPAAPTGVGKTDESYAGANDGSLTGLPVGGEYKQGAAGAWSDISSATVSGLQPDTYYVRTKATSSAFASEEATAVIGTLPAVPVAPNVSADDINDQIIGLDTTMEYQIDGGNYVRFDGNNLPVLNGSHTVKVRVAANGSVPAGAEVTLYFTAPVAAGLTVTAVDPSGTANDGKTTISAVPAATVIGHKLVYKTFGSSEVIPPKVGDAATGYADLPANGLINAAHGEKIGVAEVDADGKIVKFGFTTAVVVQEQTSGGNTNVPTAPPIITGPSSNETDVIVIVNGQIENAGKSKTTEINGLTTTTVIVDPQKLQAKLDSQGDGAIVTVPVSSSSSIIKGELNGQSIQNMDNRSATLVLRTDHASYRIPAREINIGQLAEKLSPGTKLSDISVNIIIAEPSDETNQVVQNSAIRGNFTVIVPSVDFKLIVSHKDKSIEITNFSMYVERKIALPDNVDPNKITTGIVVDPNGVNRHVPTKVIVEDGTHYAVINSLTNSTYSVVWHPLIFADMENHWAKDAVNDMGSRMIVNGVDSSTFSPNKDITRAEFAAMVVRGLGLRLGEGTHPFNDVNEQNWYSSAVQTAASYNLIAGFEDGTFRPNATITREQAMIIIARAMKLTGLAATTGMPDADELLSSFTDSAAASRWSKEGIALAVKAGVVGGRSDGRLDAKANITRAEVAAIIQRLLKKSDLI